MPNPNELAPLTVTPGALRFNTDSMKLEYYRGGPVGFGTTTQTGEWVNLTTDSPDIQTGGARGAIAGGWIYPGTSNIINYITISTTGNALDFGDLVTARYVFGGCASSTRGLFGGGRADPGAIRYNTIEFITISSTGNTQDFGDLSAPANGVAACSSSVRGLFAGGYNPTIFNNIEYVTISATGNAVDFGDLTSARFNVSGVASSTRGVFGGGQTPTIINTIEFITISTLGNAADFGDLTVARRLSGGSGCSNAIRGLFGGGVTPTYVNTIDYITISTLGNAIDFGDLSAANNSPSGCSSSTRGVFSGGQTPAAGETTINTIDYVTIMSTGNAIDFGDLQALQESPAALSNGHGGLG